MQNYSDNVPVAEAMNSSQDAALENKREQLPSLMEDYRELTLQMALYFDSLKSIDVFFAKAAQRFHEENEKISLKKDHSNEEIAVMMRNLAYAAATRGVGSIYKAYKTDEALSRIKQSLKAEGIKRLPALLSLHENLEKSVRSAREKLDKALSYPRNSIEGIEKPFKRLRSLLYLESQARYLIATYEDAAKDMLQDRVPFPSMYDINAHILYHIIMPISTSDSETQEQELRRGAIDRLVASVKETLTGRLQTKPRDLLFASDSGLMAVAISDIVPPELRETDEDGFSRINEDAMLVESIHDYFKLTRLYGLAGDHSDNALGKALLSNGSLINLSKKIIDMDELSSLYARKYKIYIINNALLGVLSFLASIDRLGLRWYWSLLIGIVAFVVGMLSTPFTSLKNIAKKKLTYIDNNILISSLKKAGYSDSISLKEIERASNRVFWSAVCGAILGFCFIPFPGGLIIGALIGAWLGDSKDEDDNPDFDYKKIKIGSWKSIILMILLIIGVLAYLYFLFF